MFNNDDIWPLNLITFSAYDHMPDGPVVIGLVRHVHRDGFRYHAIRDGGFWHHAGLQAFCGRTVCVRINRKEGRMEVVTWPEQKFVAVLPEEEMN
ncbi:MAG: hypothetical protein Q8P90_00010 [bacterium]|nr:hypothetical protein [bacterium]